MNSTEFVDFCAAQLVYSLLPIERFRKFAKNTDLIGKYAEATVRTFIRTMTEPLRVSSGAIVHEANVAPAAPPQLDAIIWQPRPLPAIFEAGDFAIVPRLSAIAYLEIKATLAAVKEPDTIGTLLDQQDELCPDTLRVPRENLPALPLRRSLVVVCLAEKAVPASLQRERDAERAAILVDFSNPNAPSPHVQDVLRLAKFLVGVRAISTCFDGKQYAVRPEE